MAKVPANRHSKQTKDPVTIDLSAEKPSEDKSPASPSPQPVTVKDGLKPTEKPVPAAVPASETEKTDPKSAKFEAGKPEMPKSMPQDTASTLKPSVTTPSTGFAKTTSSASSTASGGANVPPASKPAMAGKSGGSGFGAGLTGALIALLLAGGAYYSGVLPERSSGNAAVTAEQIDDINARLAAVEEQNSAPAQDVQGLNEAVAQLRTQVQSLSEQVSAGAGEASAVPADLDQRMAQVEARLGEAVQNQSASPEVQAQVDALSSQMQTANQSIAELTQKLQEQSDQPQAALVLVASQLRDAVTRGGDISATVTGFAALSGPSADIDALKALGSTSVPSQEEIAAQAEIAYEAMLAEAQKPASDAGVVDRLAASARALVSVRPVGPMEGEGVPETVSRMEAAVKASDLDEALSEFQKLPANVQAAGQTFADLLVSRRDALALVSAASAAALGTAGGAQ